MKSRTATGCIVAIIIAGLAVTTAYAYAYDGWCGSRDPSAAEAASVAPVANHGDVAGDQPVWTEDVVRAQVSGCECPWYRRYFGRHRHACAWDSRNCKHQQSRSRHRSSGCCW